MKMLILVALLENIFLEKGLENIIGKKLFRLAGFQLLK